MKELSHTGCSLYRTSKDWALPHILSERMCDQDNTGSTLGRVVEDGVDGLESTVGFDGFGTLGIHADQLLKN